MHLISELKCPSPRLAVVFAQSNEARCYVENKYVVGAAPTGDAPTTSDWSTILLPTKVRNILETWRHIISQYIHVARLFHILQGYSAAKNTGLIWTK